MASITDFSSRSDGFPNITVLPEEKKLPKQQQQHWFFPMGVWELMSFSSKLHCLCTKCISGLPINVWSKTIGVSLFLLKPSKHLAQRQSHPQNPVAMFQLIQWSAKCKDKPENNQGFTRVTEKLELSHDPAFYLLFEAGLKISHWPVIIIIRLLM